MHKKCKVCTLGCNLEITENENDESKYTIKGNKCARGKEYALKEILEPSRVLTSRVILKGGPMGRVPVKTDGVIPSYLADEAMELIKDTIAYAPLKKGDIVKENLLGTGINLVAARKINKL